MSSILASVRRRLNSRTGQNLVSLYGVTLANYLFPLITLPYLARVLSPEGFGSLAFVQSLVAYLSLVVEYGFTFSASREVARSRENTKRLAEILSGVLLARLLLSGIVVAAGLIISHALPNLQGQQSLFWAGLFWAVMWGFSPVWYFQGQERLRSTALLEVLTKGLSVVCVFLFVRQPEDSYKVLLFQGGAAAIATVIAWRWAWKEVGFLWPRIQMLKEGLNSGWNVFLLRALISLYTSANAFILGLFVPATQVGYYAGADRLIKAGLAIMEPLNRIYLSRISYSLANSVEEAKRQARVVVLSMVLIGAFSGAILSISAPILTWILLGENFSDSVPILQLLSITLPIVAWNMGMGIQWMLANKMDAAYNAITAFAGALSICLSVFLLIPKFGVYGLVWSIIITESFVASAMFIYLMRKRLLPF